MDISKLNISTLSAVRQNLGGKDERDTSFDKQIKEMDSVEITRCYCAWHLGYRDWADTIIGVYLNAEKAK